ncbi:MAG: toll/interleukin-1 receptor domain-containing protein [Parvularculaceae bacterium]
MPQHRYRAFISYSHADEAWGGWLQRKLETYRPPKGLAADRASAGLKPVVRDREDLPAAGNLNAEIQKALSQSEHLIVICTPNAVRSPWVNEEIKLFKRLHGGDRVLALIADGEPGDAERECFPEALRFAVDDAGGITSTAVEPLAADARESGDGKRAAFLKIAAGLLGVRLDELVRRDAQRKMRVMQALGAAAAAIIAVMAVLTTIAVNRSIEAQRMRAESENLIEFMLTDLRDKLEPVGRLDVLESVGEQATGYYDRQDLKHLDGDSISRRARALLLLGNIDERRKDLDAALISYKAAAATTQELLRRAPDDPQRIFDHAQSVFYVGDIANQRGEFDVAQEQYQEYYRLAQKLVSQDPTNPKWRLEAAYATSNLGTVLSYLNKFDDAAPYFEESTDIRRDLVEAAPGDWKLADAFAYSLSWAAYNDIERGHFSDALTKLKEQLSIYQPKLSDALESYRVLEDVLTVRRRLGKAYMALGELDAAARELPIATAFGDRLLERDGEQMRWLHYAALVDLDMSLLLGFRHDDTGAAQTANRAFARASKLYRMTKEDSSAKTTYGNALARRLATAADPREKKNLASELREFLNSDLRDLKPPEYENYLVMTAALASYHAVRGDDDGARRLAHAAINRFSTAEDKLSALTLIPLAELYVITGDIDNARRLAQRLDAMGVKRPDFIALKERLQTMQE